jgi:uncharacterized protein (DUF1697 family)
MTVWVALLQAVNVGGTGKLPMQDLKYMCEKAGFRAVRTYIASGNVVFESKKAQAQVKVALEGSLRSYAGKPVAVLVRKAAELVEVLARNPFLQAPRNLTVVIFLDNSPAEDALETLVGQKGEKVVLGTRDLRPLSRRNRKVQAENSRRRRWNGAQHEHSGEAFVEMASKA